MTGVEKRNRNHTEAFSFSSLDDDDEDNDESAARCRTGRLDFFFLGDLSESEVIKRLDFVRSLADDFFFEPSESDDATFE